MNLLERFRKTRVFAFDVDGVLTDGRVYLHTDGEQVRAMNIKDGFALQLAVRKGYRIVVISGSYSEPVIKRLNKLGIVDVFMQVENKVDVLNEYLKTIGEEASAVLFMGDDIPDFAVMKSVGFAAAPNDAVNEVKEIAHYISRFPGGAGCVRDVLETVLKLNGDWEKYTEVKSM